MTGRRQRQARLVFNVMFSFRYHVATDQTLTGHYLLRNMDTCVLRGWFVVPFGQGETILSMLCLLSHHLKDNWKLLEPLWCHCQNPSSSASQLSLRKVPKEPAAHSFSCLAVQGSSWPLVPCGCCPHASPGDPSLVCFTEWSWSPSLLQVLVSYFVELRCCSSSRSLQGKAGPSDDWVAANAIISLS